MKDLMVLGASGSLSQLMIVPALEKLIADGNKINPIGYGRSKKPKWWKWKYETGNYGKVGKIVNGKRETVIYLALPIKIGIIREIIASLKKAKRGKNKWRIALEKPFGGNLKEAEEIKKELEKVFKEEEILAVDHYLTKDLVKNIISLRFANPIIEQVWKASNIEAIKITAWEKEGIGKRGGYYDQFGAIKDMVQNHLLQILLLATMERPESIDEESVSGKKQALLRNLKLEKMERGQYRGYLKEDGVRKNSDTETWAKLIFKINGFEWKGVALIIETGKKMPQKLTELEIIFRQNLACLWQDKCRLLDRNRIVINLHPRNEINIFLNHGIKINQEMPISIPLRLGAAEINQNGRKTYEEILLNIINGDRVNFAGFEEIIYAWKLMKKVDQLKTGGELKIY